MGYLLLEGGAEFGGRMRDPDLRAIALAGGFDAPIRIMALSIRPGKLPEGMMPGAPLSVDASTPTRFPFSRTATGYQDLIEARVARGTFFRGPCAVWFRLRLRPAGSATWVSKSMPASSGGSLRVSCST